MPIITQEQKDKLKESQIKYPVVNSSCIGCSACVAISPEVFDLNEEGMSEVIFLDSYEELWVEDSISACPVDAIHWE